MQVDVVLQLTDTTAVADLHGHSAGHHVTAGQILGGGGVALHETLSLAVAQHAALSTATLGHQTAHTVNTGGVELHELGVLQGNASTESHGGTVSRAGVGGGGGEVAAAVTSGGDDGLLAVEAVDGAVLQAEGHHAHTLVAVHDQVEGVVLDEVGGVVGQGAAVQGVKHGVAGTVGGGSRTVGLTALTVVLGLTSESALVDLAVVAAREGETVSLQLAHSTRSLATHVVNSVLVTEPIGSLHGIVEVPSPIVSVLHIKRKTKTPTMLPRAALIPPWAATVWERVGNSLVMTAVLNP